MTSRRTADNSKAIEAFIVAKFEIDAILERLTGDVFLGADEHGRSDLLSRITAFLSIHGR